MTPWLALALPGLLIWLAILAAPWRPSSTRESLDADAATGEVDLSALTVLIPARNEAEVIGATLDALAMQCPAQGPIEGKALKVIVIDDQSSDQTAAIVAGRARPDLSILTGEALPEGWTGKLWALEQGRRRATTPLLLLLDADIELRPGTIAALLKKMREADVQLVSLMACLRMQSAWEKFLLPAFVYFFKLLYPFHLANSGSKWVAAAAGGCILIKTQVLSEIGGFAALKDALIDDCALARCVKDKGHRTWLGLSHSALSRRRYEQLAGIWEMVARTAFTQLQYSGLLLLLCSAMMLAAFFLPLLVLFGGGGQGILPAGCSLALMVISYLPTLKYYGLNPAWALTLPLAGLLYLLMTWSSALRHWQGQGASWKARRYSKPSG